MMKKLFVVIFTLAFSLMSCSDIDTNLSNKENLGENSNAISMVKEFHYDISRSETRSDMGEIQIDDVHYVLYKITGQGDVVEIEGIHEKEEDVFDLTTVRFHDNKNTGIAILSQAESTNRLLFYATGDGTCDIEDSYMVKQIYSQSPELLANLCSSGRGAPDEEGNDDEEAPDWEIGENPEGSDNGAVGVSQNAFSYGPLLKSYWNQGSPFNLLAPECDCDICLLTGGHRAIGCVPVAVGQCIIYLTMHKGMLNNLTPLYNPIMYSNMDIGQTGEYHENIRDWVSQFMISVAHGCKVEFDCDGSSSNSVNIKNYLDSIGYNVDYIYGMNKERMLSNIKDGFPVINESVRIL